MRELIKLWRRFRGLHCAPADHRFLESHVKKQDDPRCVYCGFYFSTATKQKEAERLKQMMEIG